MAEKSTKKSNTKKEKVVEFPQPKRNVFSRMAATFDEAGIDWAKVTEEGNGKRVRL